MAAGTRRRTRTSSRKSPRSVADAGAILIVGPAGEKNELVKHIKHSHPEMMIKIEGVESADHPSDQELVAYARRYLKSADLMRRKSSALTRFSAGNAREGRRAPVRLLEPIRMRRRSKSALSVRH